MTNFPKLSAFHQNRIFRAVDKEIEDPKERATIKLGLKKGWYCAVCWRPHHNCLCYHIG